MEDSRRDRVAPAVLGGLIVYSVVRGIFGMMAKPFWFDELSTLIIVRHPRSDSILGCLRTGTDGQPFLYFVIEKAFLRLPFSAEISLRLSSLLAFGCVLVWLYAFMRRRTSATIALTSLLTIFLTAVEWVYAIDARPYALMMAATAAALVCYQRAGTPRWTALFALSLIFGESIHYYMIFVVGCFVLGELVLWVRTRVIRRGVCCAMAASAIPLVISWPLIAAVKRFYGAHFWARPNLENLFMTYGIVFDTTKYGVALCALVVIPALVVLLWHETWETREAAGSVMARETPIYSERMVIFALAILPVIECVATKLSGGGYTWRYALALTLTVPVTLSYYLEHYRNRTTGRAALAVAASVLMLLVGLREGYFWTHRILHPPVRAFSAVRVENFLDRYGVPTIPVVIASGLEYLPMTYYGSEPWRDRLVSLYDPEKAIKYSGLHTDSTDRDLWALQGCTPLRVLEAGDFVTANPSFLLYAERPDDGYEWWPRAFQEMGYELKSLGENDSQELFLVSHKRAAPLSRDR